MNAVMRIQVRMINGASPEIKEITRQLALMAKAVDTASRAMTAQSTRTTASVNKLTGATTRAAAATGHLNRAMSMSNVTKFGKNIQWTGRQIEFNFTLPLVIATAYITKMALEQEAAGVRIAKVYGDQTAAVNYWKRAGMSANAANAKATAVFNQELEALADTWTALSNRFGIARTEVQNIAADWAAAGASGVQLAKVTNATMQAMILGEFGAAEATKALLAIQGQYGADAVGLMQILKALNAVENATGATMNDLIVAFSKAAGAARTAGVTYRQLAAMTAALVPATGSAANAGNALKTMFSRILAPTTDAITIFGKLGIELDTAAWASSNVTERLKVLGKATENATQGQKAAVSTYVASRYQVNRFDVLMRELTSSTGMYARALNATNSPTKIAATYQKELSKVLQSQPAQFNMVKETLKNTLVQAIIPMIPSILWLMDKVVALANAFQSLSPNMQVLIFASLGAIAAWGTLTRLFGAGILLFTTLFGVIGKTALALLKFPLFIGRILGPVGAGMVALVKIVAAGMKIVWLLITGPRVVLAAIARFWAAAVLLYGSGIKAIIGLMSRAVPVLLGPWGLLIAGIGILLYAFRDQVSSAIGWVVDNFNNLPSAIANAMKGVIGVLASAMRTVIDWLSYLNPFQRHSPSLVDNVRAGVAEIARQYASLSGIGAVYARAGRDLAAFTKATEAARAQQAAVERASDRKAVVSAAGAGAGVAFDRMAASMDRLQVAMDKVAAEYSKQAAVVARWEAALDKANAALDKQELKLERLKGVADKYKTQLQAAEDALQGYLDAPLVGEKAMNQAILDNQIAQSRLQLEMMKIEDVIGPIDDVRNRLAMLQGEIETATGAQAELRSQGAGSEILGVYDDQIRALQGQQSAINDQLSSYDELQSQMDALARAATRLDLGKYLNFEAVHEQIALMADSTKELTSSQVINGIRREQKEVDRLQAAYDDANAAVIAQQQVVDVLTRKRDRLQRIYDREKAALDKLGDAYDAMRARYDLMASAMNDFVTAAEQAAATTAASASGSGQSPAGQAFDNAGLGNFKDAGIGIGLPMRKDWESQVAGIEKYTERILNRTRKKFGSLDVFKPLKDMWYDALDWLDENMPQGLKNFGTQFMSNLKASLVGAGIGTVIGGLVGGPWGAAIGAAIGGSIGAFIPKGTGSKIASTFGEWGDAAGTAFNNWIVKPLGKIWDFIAPDIKHLGRDLKDFFSDLGGGVMDVFRDSGLENLQWGEFFHRVKQAFKFVMKIVGLTLGPAWKLISNVFIEVLKPILDEVVSVFKNAFKMITGLIKIVVGVVTGDWDAAWSGLKDVVSGALHVVWDTIKNFGKLLLAPFKGLFNGIMGWFQWLRDNGPKPIQKVLDWIVGAFEWLSDVLVGHSIIPDMLKAIVKWFNWFLIPIKMIMKAVLWAIKGAWLVAQWAWEKILKPALSAIVSFFKNVLAPVFKWLWENVVKPVFGWISGLIHDSVEGWKIIFGVVRDFIQNKVGPAFSWLWDNVIKPVFGWISGKIKDSWAGWKIIFSAIGRFLRDKVGPAFKWLWENVIKPAFAKIGQAIRGAWLIIKPILKALWSFIKNVVGPTIKWLWDNVVKPVFGWIWEKIKWAWDKIKPVFGAIKDFIKNELGPRFQTFMGIVRSVWDAIKKKISDVWNDGIKPVFDKIKSFIHDDLIPAFQTFKTTVGKAFTAVANGARVPINFVIDDIYNKGLKAMFEKVAGAVGFEVSLPTVKTIEKFKTGGAVRGAGGPRTDSIHAMLSHGEHVWTANEVRRAGGHGAVARLRQQFSNRSEGQMYRDSRRDAARGGFGLGGAWDWVKSKGSDAKDWTAKHSLDWAESAAKASIDSVLGALPSSALRDIGKNSGYLAADSVLRFMADATNTPWSGTLAPIPSGGDTVVRDPSNPSGRSIWHGGDFTNRFIAHMEAAEKLAGASIGVIQGGFRPRTDYSGSSHQGDAVDLQVNGSLIRALRRVGIAAGDRTGLGDWAAHVHAIPGPDAGYGAGSAPGQWASYMALGGMNQPLDSPWGLKNGGIIRRRVGGVLARIGEGSNDEAVLPLPSGWRRGESGPIASSGGGGDHIEFHGDLSFPNITDADDAEQFIENLKKLARAS
jgi:TP901 family phage tail tape measure protein